MSLIGTPLASSLLPRSPTDGANSSQVSRPFPDSPSTMSRSLVPPVTSREASREASRAVSPVSMSAPGAGAGAKAKRSAEEKRRREEAELRLLIQKEMEAARLLHARILQNEAQLAALAKQLDKQTEATDAERKGLVGEVKKWEKRLRQRQDMVSDKRGELEELDARILHLKNQKNVQKVCLASFFLRTDMKPDIAVDPDEIFTSKGAASPSPHHKNRAGSFSRAGSGYPSASQEATAAGQEASPPSAMEDTVGGTDGQTGDDGLTGRRKSLRTLNKGMGAAGRRASSVTVKELTLEPSLEFLRPKLHQIQHDTLTARTAFVSAVHNELYELYMEVASLENGTVHPSGSIML